MRALSRHRARSASFYRTAALLAFAAAFALWAASPAFAEPTDGQAGMEQSLAAADNAAAQTQNAKTELASAKEELAAKTAELEQITADLEEAQTKVDVIKEKIDLLKEGILEAQEEHAQQQKRLADVMVVMYKTDAGGMLEILTATEDINEMFRLLYQAQSIAEQAAEFAAAEAETAEKLQTSYDEVSELMDEAEEARLNLQKKQEEATAAADDLEGRISELEAEVEAAEQRAAVQAARAQTTAAAQTFATEDAAVASASGAADGGLVEGGAADNSGSAAVSSAGSGWATGVASAYGGASDSMSPNPAATATGAIADDWSMGVAVPMAWGPSQYYGRLVEISYGGQSVIATVNDCGDMGGGSRALDLQPGVFKAFGASTCDEWGLRTVSYRFL